MNKLRLTSLLLTRLLGLLLLMYVSCVQVGYAQQSGGGNYPTGNGVRVKEVDGSPNVPGTQTLVFPNGSLTRAGQTVTVTIAGGTTINSTNGQVPYRVNSTTFGDSAFASNALNSTYLSATSGASGAGLTLTVAGGGTNEKLTLAAKGDEDVYIPGALRFSANVAFSSGAGPRLYRSASNGLAMQGYAGSSNNFALFSPTGAEVFSNPIGGANLILGNGGGLVGVAVAPTAAQLEINSQSTTRPSLKLRALSGTAATQSVLESYDSAGTLSLVVNSRGDLDNIGQGIAAIGTTVNGMRLYFSTALSWNTSGGITTAGDLFLYRDAANTLAQRNGTNAQTFRVYNTYTDASNYERGELLWTGNEFWIDTRAGGTGTARAIKISAGGILHLGSNAAPPQWQINTSGHFLATTDNTHDIGASGATRPRTGYFGTSLFAPTVGGNLRLGAGANFGYIWGASDGVFTFYNNAQTDFSRLQFGGTTSSFPALKRSSAELQVVLADDTGFAATQSLYIRYGSGTPEGAVTAPVGAIYSRTDGGAGTSFYVKESGSGTNTGWVAK